MALSFVSRKEAKNTWRLVMQPWPAIPPFDPEELKLLIGLNVRVPVATNPKKNWWVEIQDVRYVNPNAALALCAGRGGFFGKPKWFSVEAIKFRGHIECPAAQAILKARKPPFTRRSVSKTP